MLESAHSDWVRCYLSSYIRSHLRRMTCFVLTNIFVFLYRWDAAQRLQEQIDKTRGVECIKRLAQSRAIKDRFGRRAIMKDLQG